ncbi:XkdF-like putative serine protease domain-containing protein [Bacillus thuringiensis]|uniref:XkdF-like putative serine protease domain-containing protein n=1 Tax=Bacillus thuringiensis TaxID=1428 RepID=UPI003A8B5FBD
MGYELKNANISYVSLVTKGANGRQFAIMKSEAAKQPNISKQVPILKTEEEKQLVTGVVYEPDVEDSHGDKMTAEEIEKAAYTFMENYQHIDKQHDEIAGKGTVVENWIAKSDMTVGEQEVQAGTWLMTVRVDDAETWEEIKKGEVTGFSMGGFGERVEIAKTDDFTHEDKGLIRKMLDFVKGETHKIAKGEVKDRFVDEKQKRDLRAVFNLFEDVFYWEIWESNPDIDRMAAALDDMKDILSSIKGGYTIAKSEDSVQAESIVLESIKKAGKVLSQKNHTKLDEALALITEIIEANNPDDVEIIDRMILNFDVYCDNGDYDKANAIATRIEKLLDREVGLKDDGILSIHRAGSIPVPDEDPSVIHINVKFLVRTMRTDLY